MLKENFLLEKIKAKQPVIGTWSVIPSTVVADILASSGLDFVILDSEHGPLGFETIQTMAIACESRQVSPVVRVSGVQEREILKALDIGAHCIQVPNVTTAEHVKQIVNFAKYPPMGNRGFSPFTRAGGYRGSNGKTLTSQANQNTLVAIHIEGQDAVDQIDKILAIDGLDIVFIGLFDLSKALGVAGEIENPKVLEIFDYLVQKIDQAGKVPGTIVTNESQLEAALRIGVRYITYSVDCDILVNQYAGISESFKALIKD